MVGAILSQNLTVVRILMLVVLTAVLARSARPAEPDLRTTLRRAGQYVLQYHNNLTTVVADELYVQKVERQLLQEPEERTLRSEFAIVRGDPDEGWFAIRDVREVDGQSITERSRIDRLLRSPEVRLRSAAFAIAVEQTKYNLGSVYRTINVPTLPLMFLLPDRQSRFRYRSGGSTTISGTPVSIVTYEERDRPTVIRTPEGRSVFSRGTLWIEPLNGTVHKTELSTNEPRGLRVVITVTYAHEARLNLLVPAKMEELYVSADERISATATYSNFRRFETDARIVR
jgi:hypothetical protein